MKTQTEQPVPSTAAARLEMLLVGGVRFVLDGMLSGLRHGWHYVELAEGER